MIFIGIAGHRSNMREQMASQITEAALSMGGGPRRLIGHALYEPTHKHPSNAGPRASRMAELMADMVGMGFDGCVFSQVCSEDEAAVIRAHGGVIWHLQGQPSSEVMIRKGDQMVTLKAGGDRHYVDAIAALSVIDLQDQAARKRRQQRENVTVSA